MVRTKGLGAMGVRLIDFLGGSWFALLAEVILLG